jgi:hypothetical protein
MRRALGTFATNDHAQLLALSRPLMRAYAARHGYAYCEQVVQVNHARPHSWLRLPLLSSLLRDFDEVLWLGADVVIVDGTQDIADGVPAEAWGAMVAHHVDGEDVPNMDVMLLRRPLAPWLREAWNLTQYIQHPWWEQAALMDLMGYDMRARPYVLTAPTELHRSIHWLGLEWNSHESSQRLEHPRFAHATYGSMAWRLGVMQQRIGEAMWL